MMQKISSACLLPLLNEKFSHLWHLAGNRPTLQFEYTYNGRVGNIYVKCEHYNLTGSAKDRMALYILYQAYKNRMIKPVDTIVKATRRNTGIAFAAIGKALVHEVVMMMPDWLSKEPVGVIKGLGGKIHSVNKQQRGFKSGIALAEQMRKDRYTSKFSGRSIACIGGLNSDLQAPKFNSHSQPDYILLNPRTEQPILPAQVAMDDASAHYQYLQNGLKLFNHSIN